VRRIFSFPNPVNEKAARVVGGVVLATAFAILATDAYGLLIPLAYGFLARVLTGPTLSPLGWIAQNVIAPALGEKKPVPGPPKRFAQGIGALISTAALVLALVVGDNASPTDCSSSSRLRRGSSRSSPSAWAARCSGC